MRIRSIDGALPSPIFAQHFVHHCLGLSSYRSPDGVNNEATTAFMVLACIGNQYRHLWVLIENLFNPTIVDAFPWVLLTCGAIVSLIFRVAEVFGVSDVIGRLAAGATARGRGGILSVELYLQLETGAKAEALGTGGTHEGKVRLNVESRRGETGVGQRPHRGCYLRRSTWRQYEC